MNLWTRLRKRLAPLRRRGRGVPDSHIQISQTGAAELRLAIKCAQKAKEDGATSAEMESHLREIERLQNEHVRVVSGRWYADR